MKTAMRLLIGPHNGHRVALEANARENWNKYMEARSAKPWT
jgi:hypothetical protein